MQAGIVYIYIERESEPGHTGNVQRQQHHKERRIEFSRIMVNASDRQHSDGDPISLSSAPNSFRKLAKNYFSSSCCRHTHTQAKRDELQASSLIPAPHTFVDESVCLWPPPDDNNLLLYTIRVHTLICAAHNARIDARSSVGRRWKMENFTRTHTTAAASTKWK